MSDKDKQVFLAKIPIDVKESEIKELFQPFGEIDSIDIKRRFAFVVSNLLPGNM